ncbi:MAG: T9SS type A sorting domain-containing protein, partial [bacterium]
SFEGKFFDGGNLIHLGGGNLQSIEMATYEGGKVFVQIAGKSNNITPPSNYPNPFNNETVITFDIPIAKEIKFEIYNVLGEKIYDFNKYYDAGQIDIRWDGTNNAGTTVASGVYFYRIITGDDIKTSKMILLK